MIDMAGKQIIPSAVKYASLLADSLGKVKAACPAADTSVQEELLIEVSAYLSDMKIALAALADADEKCSAMEGNKEQANAFRNEVVPAMEALRAPADKLEMIVDKEFWPMQATEI